MLDWYARRDQVSRLAALLVVGILLSPLLKYRPTLKAKPADSPILVQLSMPTEDPEPVVRPQAAPPPPARTPSPQRQASPVTPSATETPVPSATPPAAQLPVATPAVLAPPVPSPAPPQVNHSTSVEDGYVASVRSYLNGIKRYPTGREASIQRPRGKARIWFVLGRDGRLLAAGINESSDSLLLDRTALGTVQRGGFPAFPEAAWSGQGSHRFTVDLEFIPIT
jgi:protein TonB